MDFTFSPMVVSGSPGGSPLNKNKDSRRLWRSRRRKSSSVPEGGADFPAAIFVAGKCPSLGRDNISCCRKSEDNFPAASKFAGKPFWQGIFGFGKRGLLEKGSFQKSPSSRDSRDSREPPDYGKLRSIRPFPRDSRQSRAFSHSLLEFSEFCDAHVLIHAGWRQPLAQGPQIGIESTASLQQEWTPLSSTAAKATAASSMI